MESVFFQMLKSHNKRTKKLLGRQPFNSVSYFWCFSFSHWMGQETWSKKGGKLLLPSFSVHTLDVSFPVRIAHLCSTLSYFRCFSQPLNGPRGAQTWHKKRKMPFSPFWVHFTRRRIFSWGQYPFHLCSTEKVPFLQFVDCRKEIYGRMPQISFPNSSLRRCWNTSPHQIEIFALPGFLSNWDMH